MRAAAAFAAGNIAVGNLHQFLPAIVSMVEVDPRKRLVALHGILLMAVVNITKI